MRGGVSTARPLQSQNIHDAVLADAAAACADGKQICQTGLWNDRNPAQGGPSGAVQPAEPNADGNERATERIRRQTEYYPVFRWPGKLGEAGTNDNFRKQFIKQFWLWLAVDYVQPE